MANGSTNQIFQEIKSYLDADPRLERLKPDARAEVESDILARVFLRKASQGRLFNQSYVRSLVKYRLRERPARDPYIRKARSHAEERRRQGLPIGSVSLSMSRRSPEREPIDNLLDQEEEEIRRHKLEHLKLEL